MTVRAVEEEFWAIQYTTSVLGHSEPAFWPPDGEGKHASEAKALEAARRSVEGGYGSGMARVLHVTRRIEYGPDRKWRERGGFTGGTTYDGPPYRPQRRWR